MVSWPAKVSSKLDNFTCQKPGLLPFLKSNLLYSCLFHSGAAKRPMQCSEEFRELLAQPTFGARNLSKHWTKTGIVLLPEGRPTPKITLPPSEQSGFLFCFIIFPQMLKRSKGQISSLSLLQHCSSNRNRNCWRPEKSDLKRFRGGKTRWLSQERFCYVALRTAVFSLLLSFVWHFSLILALKTIGHSLLVTSSSHSWFQQVLYQSCYLLLNAKMAVCFFWQLKAK